MKKRRHYSCFSSEALISNSSQEDYYRADMYISMAHKVTSRSYWAFSAMVVISVVTCIVLFNHYLSYDQQVFRKANIHLRDYAKADSIQQVRNKSLTYLNTFSGKEDTTSRANFETIPFIENVNPISDDIRKNVTRNYIDSIYITIPLLGVKISSNDILILMGIAFFVISCWLFICIRSENFTVGKILSLNQGKNIAMRRYIFYGICFNNMFFPTTQRHNPYENLSEPYKQLNLELKEMPEKVKTNRRNYMHLIFFIPVLVMSVCIILHINDVNNIIKNDQAKVVKYGDKEYVLKDSKVAALDFQDVRLENNDYTLPYFRIIFISAITLTVLTFFASYKSYRYQKGTSNILYQYKRKYKHEDDCVKSIGYNNLLGKKTQVEIKVLDKRYIFCRDKLFREGKHKECLKIRNEFAEKYSEKNGYYYLTRTGDRDEALRIVELLTNSDNSTIIDGFIPAKMPDDVIEFVVKNGEYKEKEINSFLDKNINGNRNDYWIKRQKGKEHFIFLRLADDLGDEQSSEGDSSILGFIKQAVEFIFGKICG